MIVRGRVVNIHDKDSVAELICMSTCSMQAVEDGASFVSVECFFSCWCITVRRELVSQMAPLFKSNLPKQSAPNDSWDTLVRQ